MKVRNGFVSNSSSSSFILAVRKGHEVKEILVGTHPLVGILAGPAIEFLDQCKLLPLDEALTHYFYKSDVESILERRNELRDMIDGEDEGEWLFFLGEASDFDYQNLGETAICYLDAEYSEGDVRLWSQGGY